MIRLRRLALVVALLAVAAHAQIPEPRGARHKSDVVYLSEAVTVQSGQPSDVELYFRVADALHINSHTPSDAAQIPTTLTLAPAAGMKVEDIHYPSGTRYAFSFAPKEKLSVYTGDFVVKARVTAAHAGSYVLTGMLRYQACDNLLCYPPKTLPITVIVNAR